MKIIRLILLNVTIGFALCFLTFSVLDWYNPLMGFTTNAVSSKLLILFCLTAIFSSVPAILDILKQKK